jgi:hypothetical protein
MNTIKVTRIPMTLEMYDWLKASSGHHFMSFEPIATTIRFQNAEDLLAFKLKFALT